MPQVGQKKKKKKNVYMCMTESLCCTAEINTTLYINYTSIKNLKRTLFLDVHLTTMKVNFCVHLNGMWSGQILCYTLFLLVSVRVFLVRLTFELIDWIKWIAFPNVDRLHSILWRPELRKRLSEKEFFLFACLWAVTWVFPCIWTETRVYTTALLGLQFADYSSWIHHSS